MARPWLGPRWKPTTGWPDAAGLALRRAGRLTDTPIPAAATAIAAAAAIQAFVRHRDRNGRRGEGLVTGSLTTRRSRSAASALPAPSRTSAAGIGFHADKRLSSSFLTGLP